MGRAVNTGVVSFSGGDAASDATTGSTEGRGRPGGKLRRGAGGAGFERG